jgi:hypothetical protein
MAFNKNVVYPLLTVAHVNCIYLYIYILRMVGFVPGPLAGVKVSFRTYHFSVQFHFGSSVQPKSVRFFGYQTPFQLSQVSFRTYHFSVQFHLGSSVQPKKCFDFLVKDFPTVVSCHIGGRPLAGVKVSFSI